MDRLTIHTERLRLTLESLAATRQRVLALPPGVREQVSADYLKLLDTASDGDFWVLGFNVSDRKTGATVGQCGFKGPPSAAGMVEIAYAIEPEFQNQGFATEAAAALTRFALQQPEVQTVRAHSLPEANASTRVLTKCGFRQLGEVQDPEDGLVWRWEIGATKNG
ncbi:GNAT family N-acetyltransferase [Aeoliella sp. ICT_H6.2]|uniref:GNAT family N-acetyltransferase n=1 Tax=Aeoliella straminimaris TaxID=2954799 RepID=A0A9X2JG58_9BACT|nr:GNAT family N-acetyltransferase [Aeoliella straminimaris]MCO6044396.1 GNAT family N-acetyltransferase [Aeoliella straminimaris]